VTKLGEGPVWDDLASSAALAGITGPPRYSFREAKAGTPWAVGARTVDGGRIAPLLPPFRAAFWRSGGAGRHGEFFLMNDAGGDLSSLARIDAEF